MRLPYISRRQHEAEIAELRAQSEEVEAKRRRLARWLADEKAANKRLGEELAAARRELARYKGARTVPEVLEEHDVHRKALADAIHAGWHLNWQQLIDTARRTYEGAAEWRADFEAEKKRADHLQARLDQALGLDAAAVSAGETWQERREQKMRFDK